MRGKRLNRLLKLIAILRGPTGWNSRRLAEKHGISRRNVYRDIAVLELAGIPVHYDPEFCEGGAYRIRDGFWFPHLAVSDAECLDLSVLARIAESQSIPLLDQISEVRDKLVGTLPAKQQAIISEASELFDVLAVGVADHRHSKRIMQTIQRALLGRKQLEGIYTTPHGKRTKRIQIQPRRVLLSSQQNVWYLIAHDNAEGVTKIYRLARFGELRLLEKPMTIGPNFSLREFLGNAWTVYRGTRDYHIEIQFDADIAPMIAEVRWHPTQEIDRHKNGSIVFRVTVSGFDEIIPWILQWGSKACVLKPKELAEQIAQAASQLLARYAAKSDRREGDPLEKKDRKS